MGKRVARNRQATTPEVAEVMRGQGVLGSHGAGTPAPLLWIPKTERISYATTGSPKRKELPTPQQGSLALRPADSRNRPWRLLSPGLRAGPLPAPPAQVATAVYRQLRGKNFHLQVKHTLRDALHHARLSV